MKLWDCREDEHDDGGEEEKGAHDDQDLQLINYINVAEHRLTRAPLDELGSSNNFQITFRIFGNNIPLNVSTCQREMLNKVQTETTTSSSSSLPLSTMGSSQEAR